jgi:hypothetical protein
VTPRRRAASAASGRIALRTLLSGGDRRSIARSNRVLARIEGEPDLVPALAALAGDPDWLVSMRAMDLLEKVAHGHPDRVEPHRGLFLGPLAGSDKWEIRLQVVRALPLLRWTRRERKRAVAILRESLDHPQKFVRAWALDGLATFSRRDPRLAAEVERRLGEFERSDSKALQTRARLIREGLGGRSRLQQRLRKHLATPRGRARLRERVGVEHKLAHLVRRQGRRARYRGARKNLFDLRRASAIQNLEAIQRKVA